MKISIITPSYFRVQMIEQAIESVLVQSYNDFEHIIIDGGSTDGTLDLLSRYSHLLTVVGPDRGLYDAVNKGLQMASGEIIGLLNSDDYYEREVFKEVSSIFEADPKIEAVIGGAGIFEFITSDSTLVDQYPFISQETLLENLIFGAPSINAWFFRRAIFDRVGYFDLTYPIGADRDFLIRLYLNGFKPAFVNKIFYHYRRHAGSLTINQGLQAQERVLLENRRLAQKYLSGSQGDFVLRKLSKKWHDLISMEMMILLVRQKRLLDLFNVIGMAIKYNWVWPFIVIVQAPLRIKNYLKKNYVSNR